LHRVTVRVTDFETGEPLPGAEVKVLFPTTLKRGYGWGFRSAFAKTARTGGRGRCSLAALASGSAVSVEARAEGHYKSGRKFAWRDMAMGTPPIRLPWNPTLELRLDRKGTPVPMFAKHLYECHVPGLGRACGYDLEAGDWVVPDGKGRTTDILFTIRREEVKGEKVYGGWPEPHPYEGVAFQMDVEFPGEGNGLVSVRPSGDAPRHFLRTAPESGYEPRMTRKGYYHCPADDEAEERGWLPNPDIDYYLRVRTELDEEGNVVSAQYGKVYMDFDVRPYANDGGVFGDFTYYLNPVPNDRNVEFGENLFKDLDGQKYEKFFIVP